MKLILILLGLIISIISYSQEFDKGKEIFTTNCAGCHNMEKKVLGPPLQNTVETQGREWTSKWILNSSKLIAEGDIHANEIYNEYNKIVMPSYSFFSEDELSSLVDYLEGFKQDKQDKSAVVAVTPTEGGVQPITGGGGSTIPTYLWIILVVVLAILLLAAIIIVTSLKLLDSYFAKITITNSHLIKKMNLDSTQVNANVEKIFENEVEKRVKNKVKTLRDGINDNLKNFK